MKTLIVMTLFMVGCGPVSPTKRGNTEEDVITAAHYSYPKEVCYTSKATDGIHDYLNGTYCVRQVKEVK